MRVSRWVVGVLALGLACAGFAFAEDGEKVWTNKAELAAVITGGNSDSTTLSLSNDAKRTWGNGTLEVKFGFLRADSTVEQDPVLDPDTGQVVFPVVSETSAERYFANGKYSGKLSDRFTWYALLGWERDRPAAIDDRYVLGGGFGYTVFSSDRSKLLSELGLDYTDETRDLGQGRTRSESFAGARAFLGYERKLSETATFTAEAEFLQNLDESDDLRINAKAAVTASLTDALALKVGYTIAYDKSPVVKTFVLGEAPDQVTVNVELDDVDTIFAASLVINY